MLDFLDRAIQNTSMKIEDRLERLEKVLGLLVDAAAGEISIYDLKGAVREGKDQYVNNDYDRRDDVEKISEYLMEHYRIIPRSFQDG